MKKLNIATTDQETTILANEAETHILGIEQVQPPQEKKVKKDRRLLVLTKILKDPELDENTRQLALRWLLRDRELNILEWLTKTLSGSLVASFILIGVAITNANVDRGFIKEIAVPLVTSQTILLSAAYEKYASPSKQKVKKWLRARE